VAVVDSNNSTDGIDYVIPGNDDAIRAIQLYVTAAADAIADGVSRARAASSTQNEFIEIDEFGEPHTRGRGAEPRSRGRPVVKHTKDNPADPTAAAKGATIAGEGTLPAADMVGETESKRRDA
jgi:small subunit ribosomal protein S2